MNLIKEASVTLATHGSIWALPLSAGGMHNVLIVLVWGYALLLLLAMLGALKESEPKPPETRCPEWWGYTVMVSSFAAVGWLIYNGYMALGSLMLFAICGLLLINYASKQTA